MVSMWFLGWFLYGFLFQNFRLWIGLGWFLVLFFGFISKFQALGWFLVVFFSDLSYG